MTGKRKVRILLSSTSEGQQNRQEFDGEVYVKKGVFFIRYEEDEREMGLTTTTVKINIDQLKIIRHGQVESEQSFRTGQWMSGFYRMDQGRLRMQAFTHSMQNELNEHGLGTVKWEYDLEMMDDPVGRLAIQLSVTDRDN